MRGFSTIATAFVVSLILLSVVSFSRGPALGSQSITTSNPERKVLDLAAEELDGVWVGAAKPVIILDRSTLLPVCAETSSSCTKDTPTTLTMTISGGKNFTSTETRNELAACPEHEPVTEERLRGSITSFEKNRLSVSYTREQHEFDSKDPYFSALAELGLSVLPEKRSACSIMEVYLESGKVKADIKTGFDFTGNLREYIQYLGGDGSSISMCKDGILECHIDFSNYSRIVYQGHSTVTMECTSGKCLDLGPGALPM